MAITKPQIFELKFSSDTKYLENVEKLSSKVARYAKLSENESDDLGIVATELVNATKKYFAEKSVRIILSSSIMSRLCFMSSHMYYQILPKKLYLRFFCL